MAKVCEICGKGPTTGNRIIRKGLPKKSGGIGLHTTGITRRRFLPNIQKIRVSSGGTVRARQVCTSCLKAGKVTKA
jgi:large subunit ribosomal protein L28